MGPAAGIRREPTPGDRARRWPAEGLGDWLGAGLVYAASCLLLWLPLLPELRSHLPLGELSEGTVPFFNLWTLAWNAERLTHGLTGYWDAPIFYPARDTFALSEPQAVTGLVFTPLQALFGLVPGYNATLLVLCVANGLAGRCLVRQMGAARATATTAGVLFVALPFFREELGVLQLCAAWPALLALREVARLVGAPSRWAMVRLGLWTALTAWSCIYYALFLGLLVALAAPWLVRCEWLRRGMWVSAVFALGVSCASTWPLLAAERRAVAQHSRDASAIHTGSGSALAYLHFPRDTPVAKLLPGWARPAGRRSLYPGACLTLLAALGVYRYGRQQRRWLGYCAAALPIALLLSFGTRLHIGDLAPYEHTAQRYLPGFGQLRSPYRAALFVQALLAAWAGLGLQAVGDLLTDRARTTVARWLPTACVLLALFEVTPWHFARVRFPSESLQEPWIPWLADQAPGPVAMFPPNATGQAADFVTTTQYMLQALVHKHPIVNGYSGFFPQESERMIELMRTFPSAASLSALRASHVRYAVVDKRLPAVAELAQRPESGLVPVFSEGPRILYLVR